MEQLPEQRKKLDAMLFEIENELREIAVRNPKTDDWEVSTADTANPEADTDLLADAAEEADERVSILAELENRYHAIVHALDKIKTGTFGTCEVCTNVIETERLQINPAARTCILHQEEEYRVHL